MSYLQQITPPAKLPVELSEMKNHLRVTHDLDDSDIRQLIEAARDWVEKPSQLSLITTEWRLTLDSWPAYPMDLPRSPLQTLDSIKYYDTTNTLQTLASTVYYTASRFGLPAIIGLNSGQAWPATYYRLDAIQINFTVGFGDDAADVAPLAKMAIKLLAAHWYENREAIVSGTISKEIELSVHSLMRSLSMGFVAGCDA